jgi:hypothetical protein
MMSFFTRYCHKCGQPIRDGGDRHLFGCPQRPKSYDIPIPPPVVGVWASVTEGLPSEDEEVLICARHRCMPLDPDDDPWTDFYTIGKLIVRDDGSRVWFGTLFPKDVTHWARIVAPQVSGSAVQP